MTFQLQKATRKKAKLRIGLAGPSGSGKTYSALLMASGMTSWDKIALIDTENGSGELYSDLGPYNVITLSAPFSPERYIEAIKTCEKAGMEVIIIDSVTHEWDGEGGCLDIHGKMPGNSFTNWAKITPRHNQFLQAILQSSCHILTTVRKKQDYDMSDNNGKIKVTKVGLKEVQREGYEYELTLNLELDISHHTTAGKDRTGLFMDKPDFKISAETGKTLANWNNGGEEIKKPSGAAPTDKCPKCDKDARFVTGSTQRKNKDGKEEIVDWQGVRCECTKSIQFIGHPVIRPVDGTMQAQPEPEINPEKGNKIDPNYPLD